MKSIFFLFVLTFVCSTAYSQNVSDLKGPRLKNQKAHEKPAVDGIVFYMAKSAKKNKVTGPKAKNKQHRKVKSIDYAPVTYGARVSVVGPKAKNSRNHRNWNRMVVNKH